jgi:hypothetical protein
MMYLITGYKRSGKDTIADHIFNASSKATKMSLATPIKYFLRDLFGWTEEHTDGSLKEKEDLTYGLSPRQAMQYFGTEVMQFWFSKAFPNYAKNIGRSFWCVKLYENYLKVKKEKKDVVIADVRFPHEVDFFRDREECVVIKVVRPGIVSDGHASESELEHILPDYVIYNDGTLDDLYANINIVLEDIRKKGIGNEV